MKQGYKFVKELLNKHLKKRNSTIFPNGTVEELMHELLENKRHIAENVIVPFDTVDLKRELAEKYSSLKSCVGYLAQLSLIHKFFKPFPQSTPHNAQPQLHQLLSQPPQHPPSTAAQHKLRGLDTLLLAPLNLETQHLDTLVFFRS